MSAECRDCNHERVLRTSAVGGHRFHVRRAGRCLDEPRLFLEPLPLLVGETGLVKVALGAAVA